MKTITEAIEEVKEGEVIFVCGEEVFIRTDNIIEEDYQQ